MNKLSVLILSFLFSLTVATVGLARNSDNISEEKILSLYFKGSDSIDKKWLRLTNEDIEFLKSKLGKSRSFSSLYKYYVGIKNGKTMGYAVIDNEIGKSLPITYSLKFNTDFKIEDLEVLAYRETHGGQVQSKFFKNQFKGLADITDLRVGNKITNISGATLSCRALAFGSRKHSLIMSLLKKKQTNAS